MPERFSKNSLTKIYFQHFNCKLSRFRMSHDRPCYNRIHIVTRQVMSSVRPRRFWHGAALCRRFVAPSCPLPAPSCPLPAPSCPLPAPSCPPPRTKLLPSWFFLGFLILFDLFKWLKIVSFLRTLKFYGYSLGDNSFEGAQSNVNGDHEVRV